MTALPPLNGLKAFEAAARHMSFTKAAEELCVTHGAVSRHVRKLEEHLGVQLFVRYNRRIELTPAGSRFRDEIGEPFRKIFDATQRLMSEGDGQTIRLCVPPTFAIRWLVPRLARFHARFPEIAVQISTPFQPGFRQNEDMAVSYGPTGAREVTEDRLLGEVLLPVITPSLNSAAGGIRTFADLGNCTRLHSMIRLNDWPSWLQAAGANEVDGQAGLRFANSGLVYQALFEGLGVAVGHYAFVAGDLGAGRLVAPFRTAVRNPTGYYLVRPTRKIRKTYLEMFCDWLFEEARTFEANPLEHLDVVDAH